METEILNQILSKLDNLEQGQAKLEQGQANLRSEMNERFNAVDERLDNLEYSLNEVFKDIGLVEDRIKPHEREFHGVR